MHKKAKCLFFLTDKYPYGNSEAFIENEIEILCKRFERVFVIPTGLMVDASVVRALPQNCTLVPACNRNYLYRNGAPSVEERIKWTLRYMLLRSIQSVFSLDFYKELGRAHGKGKLSLPAVKDIIRSLAPELRNYAYLKKYFKQYDGDNWDIYIYSYWMRNCVCSMEKISKEILHSEPVKTICRAHRIDLYSQERGSGYLPFQEKVIQTVDSVFTISHNGYEYLRNKYPPEKDKVKISYLGTKDYDVTDAEVTHKKLRIVSCSYVIPVKRVNLIIDMLSCLGTDNVEWIHLGGGNCLSEMKQYAQQRLEGKIKYEFKGNMANEDIISFYKNNSVDVFINFSESEGLPVSIMEAMSFGIPVVATDVGGTADAVIPGVTGYLIDKNFDIEQAAALIRNFLGADDNKRQEFRKNAREAWEKRFYAERNYTDFADMLINT